MVSALVSGSSGPGTLWPGTLCFVLGQDMLGGNPAMD